jgi:hypothetical protein
MRMYDKKIKTLQFIKWFLQNDANDYHDINYIELGN